MISESSNYKLGYLDKVLVLKFVLKPRDLPTKFKMVRGQTIKTKQLKACISMYKLAPCPPVKPITKCEELSEVPNRLNHAPECPSSGDSFIRVKPSQVHQTQDCCGASPVSPCQAVHQNIVPCQHLPLYKLQHREHKVLQLLLAVPNLPPPPGNVESVVSENLLVVVPLQSYFYTRGRRIRYLISSVQLTTVVIFFSLSRSKSLAALSPPT